MKTAKEAYRIVSESIEQAEESLLTNVSKEIDLAISERKYSTAMNLTKLEEKLHIVILAELAENGYQAKYTASSYGANSTGSLKISWDNPHEGL